MLSGCQKAQSENTEQQAESDAKPIPSIPVQIARVIKGDISDYYRATGTLSAVEQATVVAQASGMIVDVLVEEGTTVKRNQVLAKLDTARLELEARRARTEVSMIKNQINRSQQLFSKGVVSRDEFERQQLEMEAKKTDLAMAELALAYGTIKAPISGVVTRRFIRGGNMLMENEEAFEVAQFNTLQVIVDVPEISFSRLQPDQETTLTVDALGNQSFKGTVARISPSINADTGTFQVVVNVANENSELKPGLFARISINLERHENTLLIPKEAVVVDSGASVVFSIDETSNAVRQQVKTGFVNDTYIEILQGLELDQQVVVVGQNSLKNQTKVSIIDDSI